MKKYKIILIANLLTLSLFAIGVFSQPTNVFKSDAIVYVSDTVVFRLTDYVGEHVKWQLSHNLEDWAEIPGATSDSLLFVADTTTYFRARVIAGFCDPYYSDVKKVQVDHQVEPGTVTDIDGNEYATVIIGNQEWMAENLRVTKYKNGDDIPAGLSNAAWESITQGAYAVYPHNSISGLDSDEEVLEAYGALYNWYSVIDARDLCPAGWQVPTDDDWNDLLSYLNDEHGVPNTNTLGGAGNALKSCRQVDSPVGGECDTSEHPRWNSHASNHGFDEFGFAALPGGYRWTSGSYHYVGLSGFYWSMTESSSTSSWGRYLGSGYGNISQVNYLKNVGFSVRCIKD